MEEIQDGGSETIGRSTYCVSENSFLEEGELTRLLAEELQEVTESTRGLANKWSLGSQ